MESLCVLLDIVRARKPDVLVLLEPKISGNKANRICARLHFEEWVRIECQGLSGGLSLFWKAPVLSLTIVASDPRFLHCRIDESLDSFWIVTFVYGSPLVSVRRLLWDSLLRFGFDVRAPWVIMGDFNAVLFAEERSSGSLG